jgi:hypothetical protein
MSAETFYKVLGQDGRSFHGGNGVWYKNRWRSVRGRLVPCVNGLHLCRAEHLVQWLGPTIWRAEYDGEMIEHGEKIVARRARVTERIDAWNERTARLFAADCAERVLHLYESVYPGDDRPRAAIQAARDFADGRIDASALDAAAGRAEFRVGAASAALSVRHALARARSAAWDAAGVAEAAAWTAAGADAWTAAWTAAGVAARAVGMEWGTEREWQARRLLDYLEGRAG